MPVRTVGIVGAGTMGSGIAQVVATAGFDVVITDVSEAALDEGGAAVCATSTASSRRRSCPLTDKAAAVGRITPSVGYDDLDPADLVIEAAPEDADLKAGDPPADRPDRSSRDDRRDQHVLGLDHQTRLGALASGPRHRHALLQPRPSDAPGRGRARPADQRRNARYR